MIRKFLLFFHTVRYLRPIQVYSRVWFRLYKPKPDLSLATSSRLWKGEWVTPCVKASALTGKWRMRFLNEERDVSEVVCWNAPEADKLWLYNLHYFNDLGSEDNAALRQIHTELLARWVSENPPGTGVGWEPYPLSLRLVNWIKWSQSGVELTVSHKQSLTIQTRWLRRRLEYHLLGNHLFANAKALVFAGAFFSGEEAKEWLTTGLDIIEQQLAEQVLADGGQFELSPMYHNLMIEDLLDLINLANVSRNSQLLSVLPRWRRVAGDMLRWSQVMTHPDGGLPFFNDAALGIAPDLSELMRYARLLDVVWMVLDDDVVHLSDSGYIKVHSRHFDSFLDVGRIGPDYIPGHGHADALSCEISIDGKRLIVNSGTSCYGTSRERLRQRGTAAHSTVVVSGQDSSEVWGGFRVAKRANPLNFYVKKQPDHVEVGCEHDGYARLSPGVIHKRTWRVYDNEVEVTDRVSGSCQSCIAYFHFHPSWELKMNGENLTIKNEVGQIVELLVSEGRAMINNSTYHPYFGIQQENSVVAIEFTGSELKVRIICAHSVSFG